MTYPTGHPYGLHRVLEPKGVLPQPAWKLDSTPTLYDNELLLDVERLNIDSASFQQLKEEAKQDVEAIKRRIYEIVNERGKMQNPVTGSGGMLIGRVKEVGPNFPNQSLKKGDKVATLVSLTLTPLVLEAIDHVDMENGQVAVSGKAILFASGPYAVLPPHIPEKVALAALDVCGAPAQTARIVKSQDRVLVLGAGGKSGLLSLYQAWKKAGENGLVMAIEASSQGCEVIKRLGIAHHVAQVDATDPVAVMETVSKWTDGALSDVTINCVNVPLTEMPAILSTRDGGLIYFFSMAIQFSAAALGAEGVGKDVQMVIGNGYAPGHADLTLASLDESKELMDIFVRRYG